jgi:hypothetical protein
MHLTPDRSAETMAYRLVQGMDAANTGNVSTNLNLVGNDP